MAIIGDLSIFGLMTELISAEQWKQEWTPLSGFLLHMDSDFDSSQGIPRP